MGYSSTETISAVNLWTGAKFTFAGKVTFLVEADGVSIMLRISA